ncbi:ABC transporter permease [Nocardia sp. NPDC057668]|uniref:ABC transporter permease n=1 Tax=Nocardia sp. NPDC057668 TaxID=3346202 RepID=UPI00366E8A90
MSIEDSKRDSAAPSGIWRIVAAREISVKLHDRNFLISTIVTTLLIVGSLVVSGFASNRTETLDVAVTGADATQIVTLANQLATAADEKVSFVAHTVPDLDAVTAQVRDESADVGLGPDTNGWKLYGKAAENENAATYLTAAAGQLAVQRNAAAAGTSVEQLSRGGAVDYDVLEPGAIDPGLAKIVTLVFAFVFYLASIMFGLAIAQSVVEEKQNRIVEILASAIPLRQLLIGKVVGNTVMALGQLVMFAAAGLIGLAATGKGGQVGQIGGAAGWFLVFFVVGFLALASMWAVAGALATRSEDLQATSTPLSMLIIIVLLGGLLITGTGRVIASYVPIISIVAMPARLAEGSATWWEPIVALAIMVIATYGIVVTAEKVYRRSLMQTQGRLTIRQALRVQD